MRASCFALSLLMPGPSAASNVGAGVPVAVQHQADPQLPPVQRLAAWSG
ncbi:hypothetical protein [Undibacterium sp.]|nr:hypothetical protein [Undibacterium sp.]HTD06471.1 hypothetical protein [Undibacterium sp.]